MAHITIRDKVWNDLQQLAKRLRRKPEALAETALREFVQRIDDDQLIEATRRSALRTGHREEDAVELVRQVRRQMAEETIRGRSQASVARRT